jgi:predicted Holliday junction resolvase-like endonuclease
MKKTWHIDIGLIIVLIILGLHCYALHKRVAYYRQELHAVTRDFTKFLQEDTARIEKGIKETKEGGH